MDALGAPQSLAVLGGTSEIGLAVAERLVRGRCERVGLAGRDAGELRVAADRLVKAGAYDVRTHVFQAADTGDHDRVIRDLFADGDVDVVLLAFGVLGDQGAMTADPDQAVALGHVNYIATVSLGLRAATALRRQGHGSLVFLSSVAAERGRAANFVYGSSKAGVDTFAQGLGDSLQGTGVHVLVVRPGFVRTRMTAGLAEAPIATTADAVAEAVVDGLARRREVVWVPGVLRAVMSGVRHLPRPLFRRLGV
jgi:decaprenylphospho-beta-D-erythro-pentofuranosid-2-ulose 2-reductase